MAIIIKTDEQISIMRKASQICRGAHEMIASNIRHGVTTLELCQIAEDYIRSQDATPAFLGYRGFPASICTSINNEVIHGVPGSRKLKKGDIISIDIGVTYKRFNGDAARTHAVGKVSSRHQKLIEVTRGSFFEGIKYAKESNRLHEISAAIEQFVIDAGFSIVKDWCGHGIGRQVHEDPQIPHIKQDKGGPRLKRGMTFAIEPMVNAGSHELNMLKDTWTVITLDGEYSAHYEDTLLITDGQPDVLTL